MKATNGCLLGLLLAACSSGSGSSSDAPIEMELDAPPGPPTCAASGATRAIVLSINGNQDAIQVLRLDGGQIVDPKISFTTVENPRDVAIRSDGREALISYGDFGQPYGVVVLDLGPG